MYVSILALRSRSSHFNTNIILSFLDTQVHRLVVTLVWNRFHNSLHTPPVIFSEIYLHKYLMGTNSRNAHSEIMFESGNLNWRRQEAIGDKSYKTA